jgi:hypothetical protein
MTGNERLVPMIRLAHAWPRRALIGSSARWALAVLGAALIPSAPAWGQHTQAKIQQALRELEPRRVTLPDGAHSVADVLRELGKQTGNVVIDQRKQPAKDKIELALKQATFWDALDELRKQAGCGFTPYSEGGIALVDASPPRRYVHNQGIVRTAIKRRMCTINDDTGVATCSIVMDVMWEPRFEPFYLSAGAVKATFAPDAKGKRLTSQTPPRGNMSVAGRRAVEIEVQLEAPDRSSPAIAELSGSLTFLGPSKMLTFTLPELKTGVTRKQEEVAVSVAKLREGADRWIVQVQIDNPEGTPSFESFQTWLDNNRVRLVQGPPGKQIVWRPEPNEAVLLETPRRAVIEYAFGDPEGRGQASDWALVVLTPGRIVELSVPFSFKDVALP